MIRRRVVAAGLLVLMAGCGGTEPEAEPAVDTIPTDVFIDAYVELRVTGLRSADGELVPAQRDSVLQSIGVTSAEMYEFGEVHGRRPQFMQAVWDSVEVRFNRRRDEVNYPEADSTDVP